MSDSATALPDPFSTSLSGRRLGRYEVLARLASGGMAAVYVGRALGVAGFERLFAVKVLHPHLAHEQEFITMFLDEARLAARIRHPNVVPTIDISDTQDAGYYLVMDYIEGDHLGALLQKAYKLGTKLPPPVALRIVVDALEGLAAAHNLTDESGRRINLVHRDVSPHNIMVSTDGIARITDFGVAKAEVRLSTTRQGQFKGKLAYMAPEHASTGEADQRSDLFSVAIILWESLTGRRLFRAENQAATLNKICIEPIPMPSAVDPSLAPFDHVLEMGLARDPAQRFQTAEEFAEAIEERAETLGGLANQRAVAKLVREYAAEKIERDSALIRSAIAEIGSAPVNEMTGAAPQAAESPPIAPPRAPAIAAPPPIEVPAPSQSAIPPKQRPNWVPWTLGVVAALLVTVAVFALLRPGEPPPVQSSPLAPSTEQAEQPSVRAQPPTSVQAPTQAEAQPSPASAAAVPTPAASPETAPSQAQPGPKPSKPAVSASPARSPRGEEARMRTAREPAVKKPTAAAADKPGPDKPRKPAPPNDLLLNPYR
ncbi:MAG: protein kinase [Polyangiales bacterium]